MSSSNPAYHESIFTQRSRPLSAVLLRARHFRIGIRCTVIAAALTVLSACGTTINYKRLTYDFLRQADCRQNDIQEFCSRTFVFEYDEYEMLRREFLRIENEKFTDHMSANERYQALHPDF